MTWSSSFGTLDSEEKTIAILGDRWWPQAAKQEGNKISKKKSCLINENVMSPEVLEVSMRSMNGAPISKGVRGQWLNH